MPHPVASLQRVPALPSERDRLTTTVSSPAPSQGPIGRAAPGAAAGDGQAAPDVEILDVTKRFADVTAVDHMTLRIAHGEFYSFLGPSGCGKTTTLRMIAGFEQPTEGEILLDGRPVAGVPPYRRNVNTVFQHYALFPHMDVAENVGYGLRQRKVGKAEEARRVAEALDLVRLSPFAKRRTWELSGGQQQRVALARALVNRPTVLLLDEPLGALDRKLRHEMQVELKALQREVGITFVYVTHDQEEALTMSDMIVVMTEGRIAQQGSPEELYQRPRTRFVAGFIGSSNFIPARLIARDPTTGKAQIETPSGLRTTGFVTDPGVSPDAGAEVTMSVRPERFRVDGRQASESSEPGWTHVPGQVEQGTYLGDQTEYRIKTDAIGDLVVRRQNEAGDTSTRTFGPGEAVVVSWHEEANLILVG
jgi:spermidine/putrescine transport system ATP-binding protein